MKSMTLVQGSNVVASGDALAACEMNSSKAVSDRAVPIDPTLARVALDLYFGAVPANLPNPDPKTAEMQTSGLQLPCNRPCW